jgi:hypothetical protein
MRLVFGFLALVTIAVCQQPGFTVEGAEGSPLTITLDDLSKLPQHTIKTQEHSTPVVFEGVLVMDILAKVGIPTGEKLGGKFLSQYLLVGGADGYRVVFALPELDAAFHENGVYMAWKRDGKPLSDKEGPFRIVVPNEKRPARWVRQVTALRVKQSP